MLVLCTLMFLNATQLEEVSPLYAKNAVECCRNGGPTSSKKTGLQAHQKLQKQYRYIPNGHRPWVIRWLYKR